MSQQHQNIIAEWQAHCDRLKTPATVGDSLADAKRARFNLMQKDFATWFDHYFPSFKNTAWPAKYPIEVRLWPRSDFANEYVQKPFSDER